MTNRKEIEQEKRMRAARCDIFRGNEKVILKLEMPGVSKESLDIRVDNDLLFIKGTKEKAPVSGEYLNREIRTGDFYQEFTLDDTIDRSNIDASIKNGVVTLTLSLKDSVKPRKITIKES